MSQFNEQWEFLRDVSLLIKFIEGLGWQASGGDLFRPQLLQNLYYYKYEVVFDDIGNGKLHKINQTKTKKRVSNHTLKKAIDLNIKVPDKNGNLRLTYNKTKLQLIGDYWEQLNPKNKWGGNYKTFLDTPHFERT